MKTCESEAEAFPPPPPDPSWQQEAESRSVSMEYRQVRDPIGTALLRLHDAVVDEPLPREFLELIAEIDRRIGKKDTL
jgi:hypothetical protein